METIDEHKERKPSEETFKLLINAISQTIPPLAPSNQTLGQLLPH